jgi:hypothetical protein
MRPSMRCRCVASDHAAVCAAKWWRLVTHGLPQQRGVRELLEVNRLAVAHGPEVGKSGVEAPPGPSPV